MRTIALLYNPIAGQKRARRADDVEAAAAVFRAAGLEVLAVATRGPGTASVQALEAIAAGCDTVIACGGDGTVHEVMQRMVAERTPATLGVLRLGTGNALANDLDIPENPVAAARTLLNAASRRVAVGEIEWGAGQRRYFMIIAGVGADAEMLYGLSLAFKQRIGLSAYYAQALVEFARHSFPWFEVRYRDAAGTEQRARVSQVLAVRIQDFGGIVRRIAPGAALASDCFRLVLFRTRSRAAYLFYCFAAMLGTRWMGPKIELTDATEVICEHPEPDPPLRIYAEADGEVLGALPVRIRIVPDALTLLVPPEATSPQSHRGHREGPLR